MKLVIVESPAKAKTIKKYLGGDFEVIASFGHVRDLPSKPGSVLPDEDFRMIYEISVTAKKHVQNILKAASSADEIYLATDPDREGEAISWHVAEVIRAKKALQHIKFFRVAFNEITKSAIKAAISTPRKLDDDLINAQQARRALDYLVGFTLSPLLWRKLPGCRSAGRVQSVALRLVAERESEIEKFQKQEYWDIELDFKTSAAEKFSAKLTHVGKDKLEKFSITTKDDASKIASKLQEKEFSVSNVQAKAQKRRPPAPFITSTLQQEASSRLGFGAKKTMQIAQKLYEGVDFGSGPLGLITYMRTDGVNLAGEAIASIRGFISSNYTPSYLPPAARIYKSKAKNSQEAHEAIRPTNVELTPKMLEGKITKEQHALYSIIWRRAVASQMEDVKLNLVNADIKSTDSEFTARATGSSIEFEGFYTLYNDIRSKDDDASMLPALSAGDELTRIKISPNQHFTQPPPRYSEASLVKKLEELGIGRPSTYAPIISVLQDREYVRLEKKRLLPEERGRILTAFLTLFFPKYVEYDFTAELESKLDVISAGKLNWRDLLLDFWKGFHANIDQLKDEQIINIISKIEHELQEHIFGSAADDNRVCPKCNKGRLHLRMGKFGAFVACDRYPDCDYKKQISSAATAQEEQSEQEGPKILGRDGSRNIFLKKGPYGWYLELEALEQEGSKKKPKPKRSPLPPGADPANFDLGSAKKLLSMPYSIGSHPDTGEDIEVAIGRFGPYVKYDGKFCSIPKSIDVFEISLDQALDLIRKKQEKATSTAKKK